MPSRSSAQRTTSRARGGRLFTSLRGGGETVCDFPPPAPPHQPRPHPPAPSLAAPPTARFTTGPTFNVGAFPVEPFLIPHDAVEPVGFTLSVDGLQVVVAYDLGDVDGALRERLPAADVILLEANYDPRLLGVSGYPWFLKNRILSPTGHLSNESAAGAAVWAARGGKAQTIFLLHLSEVNNLPPLARDVVRWALEREGIRTARVQAVRSNAAGPLGEALLADAVTP